MGNAARVAQLKSSMAQYQSSAGGAGSMPGIVEPDQGFVLKGGLNGGSLGKSLPIYQGPGDSPTLGAPQSENAPASSGMGQIIEPDKGFVDNANASA